MIEEANMDDGYERIYYQTIADLRIDPVVGPEGCIESGTATVGRHRPVQLAAKALAKASEAGTKVPRKRAPRKATGTKAGVTAKVPAQGSGSGSGSGSAPAKAARGTAKVASSE